MRANPIKTRWAAGQAVVNGWLAIPHSLAAETMAQQGWDSLTVDMQHGLADHAGMLSLLTAISASPCAPVVRVPWLEESSLMRVLDAGAYV
ncbi:MAG: 5-keto-4-deoxy-D-glucarate aldolase [Stenotrophomonas maltophilia]|nr:MAG: 5-keto-4-deoxy-D-glucarate aldolase [Stenotrophomonas maltophilia]